MEDMPAFVDSQRRLVDFAEGRNVTQVVDWHVEMTARPGGEGVVTPGAGR